MGEWDRSIRSMENTQKKKEEVEEDCFWRRGKREEAERSRSSCVNLRRKNSEREREREREREVKLRRVGEEGFPWGASYIYTQRRHFVGTVLLRNIKNDVIL